MTITPEDERQLQIDHDNAEADAVQQHPPNWHIWAVDQDYRRRFTKAAASVTKTVASKLPDLTYDFDAFPF